MGIEWETQLREQDKGLWSLLGRIPHLGLVQTDRSHHSVVITPS